MMSDAPILIHGLPIAQTTRPGRTAADPTLLLLHGWGANRALLQPLIDRLPGYRILAPDLPGFGETPPPPTPWTVFDYAKLTLNYLDAHGVDRALLFGHSFGGRLGLILGAEHPDRILKMSLSNSAGVRLRPSAASQMRGQLYRGARTALERVGFRRGAQSLRDWYNARYGSSDFKAAQGTMRETFIHVVSEDLLPYAARVAVPTLLIWGDRDQDTPLWQGRLLEQTIPDAGLVLYEGAGHYTYLERAAEVARVMDYFFTEQERQT